MRTGAGPRSSLALLPPRRRPPLRPRGPGETLREGAATFQRLRPGLGRLERVPAPRVPPGCAPAAERAMRAFGAGPASTGPRHPVPAGGPLGPHRRPHRHAHPGFRCGGFGARSWRRGGQALVSGRGAQGASQEGARGWGFEERAESPNFSRAHPKRWTA